MDAETGETIKLCVAANTDEGWFEQLVEDPVTKRIVIEGDRVKSERVTDRPFYIVDKATGQKLQ